MKLRIKATDGPTALAMAILLWTGITLMTALPAASPAAAAGLTEADLPNLVATLLPSVVNITTTRYKAVQIPPGQSVMAQVAKPDTGIWFGTGFIVTTDGYVITNKHVIHNGISFTVTLSDGAVLPASLIAESCCADIGVIKIRGDRPFPKVKLGDSDSLRRGDFVIVIGNPLGFQSTVSTGIISALNRDFHFTDFDDFIQTDAAINEGNSGGPMFNANGEVIGVNSVLYTTGNSTGNIGIGLAIPINDAKAVVAHMREIRAGKIGASYLGAKVQSLTPELAEAYGLPGPWGSIVVDVKDGGPAAQAGLRPGDIITSFGTKFAADSRALMRDIVETVPGTTVGLVVIRGGTEQTVPVTLAALPAGQSYSTFLDEPGVPKPVLPPEATTNFGLEMAAITPELRARYKLGEQQQGVVITGVAIGSTAANTEINAGTVILRVRDTTVSSPDDVLKVVADERQQKRPFVPMLIAHPSGRSWISLRLD